MENDIKNALSVLQDGGVILYPTDTIWGLGCDATNADAVKKIYEIKKRSESQSMLVLLDSSAKLQGYVSEVPEIAWDLIELATNPLTIIYPGARNLAENLLAADGSVGIRVTSEQFSMNLCRRFKRPIVSTSANVSGQKAPVFFDEIVEEIINAVDYVVGYRQEDKRKSKPSSILKLGVNNEIEVIRK